MQILLWQGVFFVLIFGCVELYLQLRWVQYVIEVRKH